MTLLGIGGLGLGRHWTPDSIANSVEFWDILDLRAAGYTEGTAVTGNWLGRRFGTIAAPFASDMGTFRDNCFNFPSASVHCGLEMANKALKVVDSLVTGVFSGTGKTYTVWTLAQLKTNATNQYWGVSDTTATNVYTRCFYFPTAVKNRMTQQFNATAATTHDSNEFQAEEPQLMEWNRSSGGTWNFIKDGISEASFTEADRAYTTGQFVVGASAQGTATVAQSSQYLQAFGVVTGDMALADQIKLRRWAADRMGMQWKVGLTGGLWRRTKVIVGLGQSNGLMEGRGTVPYTVLTAPRAYAFAWDTNLKTADDPQGDNTNNSYTSFSHGGQGSAGPEVCNDLFSHGDYGDDEASVIIGHDIGGTSSQTWAAGATTSPPGPASAVGIAKLRQIALMRNLPSPTLYPAWLQQGESNSGNQTNVDQWPIDWTAIANEWSSWTTNMGWVHADPFLRFILTELVETNWSSTTAALWQNLKRNMSAWAGGRVDTRIIKVPLASEHFTGTDHLHYETDMQRVSARLYCAAVRQALAASKARPLERAPVPFATPNRILRRAS